MGKTTHQLVQDFLALRGVEASSYPLNMTEFSDFLPKYSTADRNITMDNHGPKPSALAPILFYQPASPNINLTYVVTIEWRVRFDPYNPAAASHVHHNATPDSWWNYGLKEASQASHAIGDIVENVANMGREAARMHRSIRGGPMPPAIADRPILEVD